MLIQSHDNPHHFDILLDHRESFSAVRACDGGVQLGRRHHQLPAHLHEAARVDGAHRLRLRDAVQRRKREFFCHDGAFKVYCVFA